jgi:hypothetical protein
VFTELLAAPFDIKHPPNKRDINNINTDEPKNNKFNARLCVHLENTEESLGNATSSSISLE